MKEEMMNYFEENVSFIKHNNIHIKSIDKDKVELYANLTDESFNPYGSVHGGLIFGLADTAMGSLALLTGRKAVTVDSNISYLKPCKGKMIKCVATPVKVGKTIAVFSANIYNDKDELAAVVNGNFMFIE